MILPEAEERELPTATSDQHCLTFRYFLIGGAMIGVIAATVISVLWANVFRPVAIAAHSRCVIVPEGATLSQVVDRLHRRRVIRHPTALVFVARFTGIGARLQAGGYRLDKRMSPYQILEKIASGKIDLVRLTIPEGFTILQIGERLEEKGIGNARRFASLARNPHNLGRLPSWVPAGSLEGFLFPDTYYVPVHEDESKTIMRMLTTFEKSVLVPLGGDIARSPFSLKELITLASLVEREARVPGERALIAGVLVNRLARGMRLQCDATVQYARGSHKHRLFFSDLKIDSPFNTYLHPGLPPGPIANPGRAAIEAALHPATTDYLFYVARADGTHVFSRTFAEHERAIRAIRLREKRQNQS